MTRSSRLARGTPTPRVTVTADAGTKEHTVNTVIDVTAALVKRDPVVVQLERARDALAKATAIHQVKGILDVAAAGEIYARRRQLGEEALAYAHTVKIEALARLGELLRDRKSERSDGGRPRKTSADEVLVSPKPTLADLGITRKTAATAQQLAALPSETRSAIAAGETTLTEARRNVSPVTILPLTARKATPTRMPRKDRERLKAAYGGKLFFLRDLVPQLRFLADEEHGPFRPPWKALANDAAALLADMASAAGIDSETGQRAG
jgi:hypothetical protein